VEGHELESVRIYILQRVYRVYVHASVIIWCFSLPVTTVVFLFPFLLKLCVSIFWTGSECCLDRSISCLNFR
jgi:hypothetical protein